MVFHQVPQFLPSPMHSHLVRHIYRLHHLAEYRSPCLTLTLRNFLFRASESEATNKSPQPSSAYPINCLHLPHQIPHHGSGSATQYAVHYCVVAAVPRPCYEHTFKPYTFHFAYIHTRSSGHCHISSSRRHCDKPSAYNC